MAFQGFGQNQGFGKDSGPVAAPKAEVFGRFPSRPPSPTPPFSTSPLQRSTRDFETPAPKPTSYLPRLASRVDPSLNGSAYLSPSGMRPSTPPLNNQSQVTPQRTRSPPGYSQNHALEDNIGSYAQRPSTPPLNNQSQVTPQRTRSPPGYSQNHALEDNFGSYAQRPATSSPMWGNHVRFPGNFSNSWTREDHSGAFPSGSAKHFANKHADTLVPIGTRPPPQQSASLVSTEKSSRSDLGSPAISPTMWGNQVRLPGNLSNSWSRKDGSAAFLSDSGKSFFSMHAESRVPVRNRSPPLQPQNGVSHEKSSQTDPGRTSPSLPKMRNISDSISTVPDSGIRDTSLGFAQRKDNKAAVNKDTNYPISKRNRSVEFSTTDEVFQRHSAAQFVERSIHDRPGAVQSTHLPVSKRTRSPPLPANQVLNGNSSPPDDSERELQAKAKRLARFKVELSQPEQSTIGKGNPSHSVNKRVQSLKDRSKIIEGHSSEMEEDSSNAGVPSDYEAPDTSAVIVGLCPDMCPQLEREERERKGDLDQFERLDGDRNRTTKSLAIKKYTRTAEREAELIRPMPILQKTIDYLLYLLDQPYDEKFLGLYNFLWDRMRAIRMDLRMQHLFNLNAITMLEQMIRLHIIAMHELCEHTKGEGFSEGFDAHLNIEQMNKTSVELFQLYEDHRKKGINVPTEKEFRGYYALLKLDKHPGYKVEPAELSHDLSKMTPEIRQTSEVLFARDVARACRTGNFIAFFRLARKASYLQACLMHAHFAKLRTQALASLHCGLQNNQGIPVTLIAKWLAMEEDDIENLLDYHGFVIKDFEEPYMVKEGPFLNNENDYPLKYSSLVHSKRSEMIVDDVSSPPQTVLLPPEEPKAVPLMKVKKQEIKPDPVHVSDDVMVEHGGLPSPKGDAKAKFTSIKKLPFADQSGGGNQMAAFPQLSRDVSFGHKFTKLPQASVESFKTPNHDIFLPNYLRKPNDDTSAVTSLDRNKHAEEETMAWQAVSAEAEEDNVPFLERSSSMKTSAPPEVPIQGVKHELLVHEEALIEPSYDEEAYEAKLRLFLRIWRRRSVKIREVREQRQLAAVDALGSLSLGPPVRQKIKRPIAPEEFNIDHIMNERYQRHERSWSRLNVSDVIAGIVCERNAKAKCICWKMIIQGSDKQQQSQFTSWSWLLSKLIPSENYEEDDLILPSPGISIWRRWVPSQNNPELTCILSVVRKAELHNVSGANAVLFLVSESISLEVQKGQLHSLVMSLPSGSHLPLLILIDSSEENMDCSSAMAEKLGLLGLDRSRIGNSSIVFLVENRQQKEFAGFFCDEKLRGGLQWLASHSPPPPVVSSAKTHELVSTHLSSTLEMLDRKSVYEVGPHHCISAFNDALYQAAEKVAAAADANVSSWPCPEIAFLDKSSHEYEVVKLYLPNIGWDSSEKIEPAISAIRSCELASFHDDISWLFQGCNSGSDIENHRILLTNCLVKYLSEILGSSLAIKEAHVMLQQSARLELQDSTYYIVPNWIKIFQRIFNWRLMSLSDGAFSKVYVLEQDIPKVPSPGFDTSPSLSPYEMTYPSLDEMVEVSFGSLHDEEEIKASQLVVTTALDFSEAEQVTERSMQAFQDINMVGVTDGNHITIDSPNESSRELVPVLKASREADRLSKLLEQCNTLQDNIDKKLSIYF